MFKYILFMVLIFAFISGGCKKEDNSDQGIEARILFSETAYALSSITSQIQSAKDSASIDLLSKILEKRMTDINFSVAPETDFDMTEQENDSLFKLMEVMKSKRQQRLEELATNTDSIAS